MIIIKIAIHRALGQELGPSECGDFLPELMAMDITSK
jgi:hypothetical protein